MKFKLTTTESADSLYKVNSDGWQILIDCYCTIDSNKMFTFNDIIKRVGGEDSINWIEDSLTLLLCNKLIEVV